MLSNFLIKIFFFNLVIVYFTKLYFIYTVFLIYFGLVYYLVIIFFNSYYFCFVNLFYLHEPSCKIVCSCNSDPSLVKNKTRAKLTLSAKFSLVENVPSCKNVFVQKLPFVQKIIRAILCPRAKQAPCKSIFVQFCT